MTKETAKELILQELEHEHWKRHRILKILVHLDYKSGTGFKTVVKTAAIINNVSVGDMMSKNRQRPIVNARNFVYWFLREQGYSLTSIGEKFDRDHATVINGLRGLQQDLDTNFKPTVEKFNEFKKAVKV